MTRVYRIVRDERYQGLVVQDAKGAQRVFDALPFDTVGSPPLARVLDPEMPPGDLWHVEGGAIAIGPTFSDPMGFFEMAGETLPIQVDGTELVLLNVLECLNSLDRKQTVWRNDPRSGLEAEIVRYVFHPRRFTVSSLFKIPETCEHEVLVVERTGDSEDELKAAVEEAGLTGIAFELLWEDPAA
jgi:hypothetical protein